MRFLRLGAAVLTTTSANAERVLLVHLSERERQELREHLIAAGFEVTVALTHADVCLRLLTWRPNGVIADGDFPGIELDELANVIRASAPVPIAVVFLCRSLPRQDVSATLLLKPVAIPDLLTALRKEPG